ncbi:hypothetical protein [Lysinibacillus telephonicus]|uniref:hypothetical protein n=1 Tax=Lysinibacillus telephonicus TaxID=1714840 RepID=UPI003BA10837
MIDFNISELIHRQIILDLTIRTFERDRKHLSNLKMHKALEDWYEVKIKELQNDLRKTKSDLSKQGVKIQSETKIDELITEFGILEKGNLLPRRYMNIALRNWVEEETRRVLGLPFRTMADSIEIKKPLNE